MDDRLEGGYIFPGKPFSFALPSPVWDFSSSSSSSSSSSGGSGSSISSSDISGSSGSSNAPLPLASMPNRPGLLYQSPLSTPRSHTDHAPIPAHAAPHLTIDCTVDNWFARIPPTLAMSTSGIGRNGTAKSHGRSKKGAQTSIQQLVDSLETHRINTLTELCRIERVAASTENEEDARAFQGPMTAAWTYYVGTNFLTELRGLTRSYPFSADLLAEAKLRVTNDPDSNRSWNMAWLCLMKMLDDDLVTMIAGTEAALPEMWGGRIPTPEEAEQLTACFLFEWTGAIHVMLRHWPVSPTWY